MNTLAGYEIMLRVHVLPLRDGRSGLPLGDLPADAVDARTLQAAVDGLVAQRSPETARMAAAAISAVLRDLYLRGLVDVPPPRIALPPPARGRDRALSTSEADRLLAAAEEDDERLARSLMAPLVAALVASGARISEVLRLVWGPAGLSLESKPPCMTVARGNTKTDAGARIVPIEPAYAAILRRHRLAGGNPPDGVFVFADENGRPLSRHGRIRTGLRRVARAAGLEPLGPHVLRHSQGTWLASAGVPTPALAARLGHTRTRPSRSGATRTPPRPIWPPRRRRWRPSAAGSAGTRGAHGAHKRPRLARNAPTSSRNASGCTQLVMKGSGVRVPASAWDEAKESPATAGLSCVWAEGHG
jgi:integrase